MLSSIIIHNKKGSYSKMPTKLEQTRHRHRTGMRPQENDKVVCRCLDGAPHKYDSSVRKSRKLIMKIKWEIL